MKISALQQARAAYQPKLPQALKGFVKAVEGEPTQSVGKRRAEGVVQKLCGDECVGRGIWTVEV